MSRLVRLFVPVVALGFGAAVVSLPGGCSRKSSQESATVRGAVTFQGLPLAGGLVVFGPAPDRGTRGRPARGTVGTDGRFEVRLGGEPATPGGWSRVAIAPAPATLSFPDSPAPLGPV